jgi:hypothetical protein
MPLTAVHPSAGVLDATLTDLGVELAWEVIHRPKVPVGLTCRGCESPLHAKVSPTGLHFFAHNREVSDCPLNGESIDHRLLKAELAAALRQAGWNAELEVPGNGWRADVLGISPDGRRRMAWEAQLASATIGELDERTAKMAADGVEVCWVTDKDAHWLRHLPGARVRRTGTEPLQVVDGAAKFTGTLCPNPAQCNEPEHPEGAPCPGHGSWSVPSPLSLADFVLGVCADRLRPWPMKRYFQAPPDSQAGGATVWTAKLYAAAEAEHLRAEERHNAWLERQEEAERAHARHIEDLMGRQQALVPLTVAYYKRTTGRRARALDGDRDPAWAMGVPVLVDGNPVAVICPVASRVQAAGVRQRLAGVTVVVASRAEQERLAKVCAAGQQFKLTEVRPRPATAQPPATRYGQGSISVGQAVARMFGGY